MLTKGDTGLLVIDIQGKLSELIHESSALFEQVKTLINGANLMGLPIICMEQLPNKLGKTRPEIAELITSDALEKSTFSGWRTDAIAQKIKDAGCEHWLVVGIEAHVCVYQTVADLLASGFMVELVTDAVGSRVLANKDLAVRKMESLGARLTSVEMALFELQEVAEGEEFRQLIKIIK